MKRGHVVLEIIATTLAVFALANIGIAQTFTVIHTFTGGNDGSYPTTPLVLDGFGNLFGATSQGGSGCSADGCGAAFEQTERNGHWGLSVLLDFSGSNNFFPSPVGPLALDTEENIYGTDFYGGDPSCNCGTIFQVTKSGGVWTQNILYSFLGGTSDGQYPQGLVRDSVGNLYGATQSGGMNNRNGVVWKLAPNADGTWTYSIIHSFGLGSDGALPYGPLTIDSTGNLYGTTSGGGINGFGTAFKLSLSKGIWSESVLYNFSLDFGNGETADGVVPDLAGNLYGATVFGGEYSLGTIYKLTRAAGFWKRTVLYTFTGNNDGAYPYGGLTMDKSGALYGTANYGGIYVYGTAYKLTRSNNGQWRFAVLHSFRGGDGSEPDLGVILDKTGNLYGVANSGGAYGKGVVFKIVP